MVFYWGIRYPQQSTDGASGVAGPSMWPGGGGDAAGWRNQVPPGATAEPTGGYLETFIVNYRLVEQALHFVLRRRYIGKGGWSWSIWRDRRHITGRGVYILGTDRRDFYNVYISETRVLTEHRMILVGLKGYRVSRNRNYCNGRSIWPIVAPKGATIQEEDAIFNNLKNGVKKSIRTAWEKATWISEAAWRLTGQRTALRQKHTADQGEIWAAMRLFQAALQEDKRRRVSNAGAEIETLVAADQTREV